MAIKVSNQITFTEHKKIKEIKEWYLASPKSSGVTVNTNGWTSNVQTIDKTNKYLWNYEETIYSIGDSDITTPVIIGVYGADGKGISSVTNYYTTTTNADTQPSNWSTNVPALTPTNKYLWNYEYILYTDGTHTTTTEAIIGAYGDSGADAVDFQIYSVDGFEFNDSLTSITLQTVAIQNGSVIQSGTTYQWMWWNSESTKTDKYENISGATSSSLTVQAIDLHAFASLKCKMQYDGIIYEDYVSLTQAASVYTAMAKFFDNNNVIDTNEDYLIVYIELYKNNDPEEMLHANSIYTGTSSVSTSGLITTGLTGTFKNGEMKYFVCQKTYNGVTEYNVILGKYNSSSGKWYEESGKNNYTYKNDLFANTLSPVVFVPKNKISRFLNLNFEIYDSNGVSVARTSAMLLDLNDPTISSTTPTNPKDGQLWLDTSVSPSVLKMWNGEGWVSSGAIVYTSQPVNGYSKGDLWILSSQDAKLFTDMAEGTMLKANTTSNTFSASHWEDVDKVGTEQKQNIKQYFYID